MKKKDEQKLRKQVRSNLQERHQKKQQKLTKADKTAEVNTSHPGLSVLEKKYIRIVVEEELYSQHDMFIKSENHLNEIRWLTAIELADQYEYYPVESEFSEKIRKIFKKVGKIPPHPKSLEYAEQLRQEINLDIEKRIEDYQKSILEHEKREKENRVDEIIKQEEEEFYKNHPDYKKFANELGQTKWMTENEYNAQEEFSIEVKSLGQRILIYSVYASIAIVFAVLVWFLSNQISGTKESGYLVIQSNESRGHLYINKNLYVGFSQEKPILLPVGKYEITLKKSGFISNPNSRLIEISETDTIKTFFELNPFDDTGTGTVLISSEFSDAKLFVNNEFFGTVQNMGSIALLPGIYKISLQKDHYETFPKAAQLEVSTGDIYNLSFSFVNRRNGTQRSVSSINSGLLEVSANIIGARIYLNGKDSGNLTNYVFNKLKFGEYNITLEKEGFQVFPREKVIRLNKNKKTARAEFKLVRNTAPVQIKTSPVAGPIFINDKKIGEGNWTGSLPVGEHKIQFGAIDYYQSPGAATIKVNAEGENKFNFHYTSKYNVVFTPEKIAPKQSLGAVFNGYLDESGQFVNDLKIGPDVMFSEKVGSRVWRVGYAFSYKNPPGNDALMYKFKIPPEVEISNALSIKLWGYRSSERYPFELSSTSSIRIVVNGTVIQNNYRPRYDIDEIDENKHERFIIGNLLRRAENSILISTTPENATFFILHKVTIE